MRIVTHPHPTPPPEREGNRYLPPPSRGRSVLSEVEGSGGGWGSVGVRLTCLHN